MTLPNSTLPPTPPSRGSLRQRALAALAAENEKAEAEKRRAQELRKVEAREWLVHQMWMALGEEIDPTAVAVVEEDGAIRAQIARDGLTFHTGWQGDFCLVAEQMRPGYSCPFAACIGSLLDLGRFLQENADASGKEGCA